MSGYEWHDFVGNIGVICILAMYLMVQLEKIDAQSLAYSIINGLGAALILISLAFDFNLSSFVIEIVWLVISIVGIVRYFLRGSPS